MKKMKPLLLILLPVVLTGLWGCPDKHNDPEPTGETYPHTTFDLDEYESTMDDFGKGYGVPDLGRRTRPQTPILPAEPLVTVVAADARSLTDLAAQGHMAITVTANIDGTVFLGRASNVIINLNGYRIDDVSLHQFGFPTSAANRIVIVGPGKLGSVNAPQSLNGYPDPTDIVIDGVWIGPDFKSTPREGGIGFRGQRIGVVNCIIRGFSERASGVAGPLMGGDDICFFNTNIGAGQNANGNLDDWGYRMSDNSNRHVLVNCMIQAKNKPCVRQGGAGVVGRVLYSTPDARDTDRKITLYNPFNGNTDASIPQPTNGINTIHTNLVVSKFVRWIAGNQSLSNVSLWGPGPMVDQLYVISDLELICQTGMLSRLGQQARADRELLAAPDELWDFDAGSNSETAEQSLSIITWPLVVSPLAGNVGSDPYEDPD